MNYCLSSSYQLTGSSPALMFVAVFNSPASSPHVAATPPLITPETGPLYFPGNAEVVIRTAPALTGDAVVDTYHPRTALGRKLLALRRAYINAGGQLMDEEALAAELQLRRGGVASA